MGKSLSEMTLEELWELFPITLCDHRDVAEAYERLKLGLWKRFEHGRDGYTEAKRTSSGSGRRRRGGSTRAGADRHAVSSLRVGALS